MDSHAVRIGLLSCVLATYGLWGAFIPAARECTAFAQPERYVEIPKNLWGTVPYQRIYDLYWMHYILNAKDTTHLVYVKQQFKWNYRLYGTPDSMLTMTFRFDSVTGRGDQRKALITILDGKTTDSYWFNYARVTDGQPQAGAYILDRLLPDRMVLQVMMDKILGDPTTNNGRDQRAVLRFKLFENPPRWTEPTFPNIPTTDSGVVTPTPPPVYVPPPTVQDAMIQFWFVNSVAGATVWLDDISITREGDSVFVLSNAVLNGDFSVGTSKWQRYGPNTFNVSGGVGVVQLGSPLGSNNQLWQQSLILEIGHNYIFRFRARASQVMNIQARLIQDKSPYKTYGFPWQTFALTEADKAFSYTFKVVNP